MWVGFALPLQFPVSVQWLEDGLGESEELGALSIGPQQQVGEHMSNRHGSYFCRVCLCKMCVIGILGVKWGNSGVTAAK